MTQPHLIVFGDEDEEEMEVDDSSLMDDLVNPPVIEQDRVTLFAAALDQNAVKPWPIVTTKLCAGMFWWYVMARNTMPRSHPALGAFLDRILSIHLTECVFGGQALDYLALICMNQANVFAVHASHELAWAALRLVKDTFTNKNSFACLQSFYNKAVLVDESIRWAEEAAHSSQMVCFLDALFKEVPLRPLKTPQTLHYLMFGYCSDKCHPDQPPQNKEPFSRTQDEHPHQCAPEWWDQDAQFSPRSTCPLLHRACTTLGRSTVSTPYPPKATIASLQPSSSDPCFWCVDCERAHPLGEDLLE